MRYIVKEQSFGGTRDFYVYDTIGKTEVKLPAECFGVTLVTAACESMNIWEQWSEAGRAASASVSKLYNKPPYPPTFSEETKP